MSIIKRKAGSKDIVKSILEFDEVPTEGSPNLVESGAVAKAIGNLGQPLQWKGPATVAQLNAGITGIQPGWTYTLTDSGTLTDGSIVVDVGDEVAWTADGEWFQVGPSLVELKADVVQAKSDIADIQDVVPEEASDSNKLVTKDELDNVQESIQSGFTPKGEISVSDLNDLTTQSNGDQYILTDSGTITDGSVTVEAGDSVAWNSTDSVWYKVNQYALSKYGTDEIKNLPTTITVFRTGDVIPVDGPLGTAKMSKDDLLREAAQNALEKAFNLVEGVDYTDTSVYDATYANTVFNPTNGPSINSDYISYGLIVTTDTNLYVKSSNTVYFSICVYPSNQSFTNGVRYRRTAVENTLPTENSPLAVHSGEYIVISTRQQDNLRPFDIFFTDWIAAENLLPNVALTQRHIQQVTDSIKDRLYIQKRDLTASKDIYVYVPAKVGYIRYAFHFSENLETESNFSLWRLLWVDACKEDLTYIDHLNVAGEWECALRLKNAHDFMGGETHGDEIMSNVGFWVDGQEVSFAELANGWCREFRLVRKSTMYDPTDHTTATAEHGCEYVFNLEGMTINQSVKWLVAATLTNCYMGMNLPKKSYTTKGYIDLAIDPSSIPAYSIYQDASKMVLWDATSGVFNLFENLGSTIADYLGNNSLYFTDNGGHAYNKGYYCITYTTQQVDVPANTVWKSKTHYVYDVATDLSST